MKENELPAWPEGFMAAIEAVREHLEAEVEEEEEAEE